MNYMYFYFHLKKMKNCFENVINTYQNDFKFPLKKIVY